MSAGNDREFIDYQQNKEREGRVMKCPLRRNVEVNAEGGFNNTFLDCLKEECAWWSKSMEACCIPVLAANLMGLNQIMLHLADKMPHEEQLRK